MTIKKLTLGLGAIVAVAVPTAAVVSCSFGDKDEKIEKDFSKETSLNMAKFDIDTIGNQIIAKAEGGNTKTIIVHIHGPKSVFDYKTSKPFPKDAAVKFQQQAYAWAGTQGFK